MIWRQEGLDFFFQTRCPINSMNNFITDKICILFHSNFLVLVKFTEGHFLHDTFMKSFGIELSDDDKRLPYLYWTPKLHKSPVKHRFIAGSSKCTTTQLSSLLTKILTVIKTGLEKYCSIKTSHTGVNNMWILKNSTKLLSSLGHLGVRKATSIQTFDFSTLYTSIPHDLLKSRMNNIINNAFKHKNGATQYTHIKVGRNKSYFTSDPLNGDNKYTANDICK